jgi:hypothetical protein
LFNAAGCRGADHAGQLVLIAVTAESMAATKSASGRVGRCSERMVIESPPALVCECCCWIATLDRRRRQRRRQAGSDRKTGRKLGQLFSRAGSKAQAHLRNSARDDRKRTFVRALPRGRSAQHYPGLRHDHLHFPRCVDRLKDRSLLNVNPPDAKIKLG